MLNHSGISESSWGIQAVSQDHLSGERKREECFQGLLSPSGQHFTLRGINTLALLCSTCVGAEWVWQWHQQGTQGRRQATNVHLWVRNCQLYLWEIGQSPRRPGHGIGRCNTRKGMWRSTVWQVSDRSYILIYTYQGTWVGITAVTGNLQSWALSLVLSLTSCVILKRSCHSLSLFPDCKMREWQTVGFHFFVRLFVF